MNFRTQLIYDRLSLLALNMFRWEGLPDTIQERHIEKAFFKQGKAVVFDHEDFGLICLPCDFSSGLNIYGEPNYVIATGHAFNRTLSKKNAAVGYNNDLATPTEPYIRLYAQRMGEVDFSIDINIRQQRIPYIVETSKNNKLSMELIFKQILDEGKNVVYANKDLGLNNSSVITLNSPYVADKLNTYKYDLEREILTFLALNNTVEKKERLLVDEVNSNNDYIERNADIMYKNRVDFANEINKKFGTNIKVHRANDLLRQRYQASENGEEIEEVNVNE